MQKIKIALMSFKDLETISSIFSTDFDTFWTIQNLKSELINPNSYCYIAKIENEIVGFIVIWKVIDEMHLNDIVVKKNFRNLGIGSLLLEHVINVCNTMNRYNIYNIRG